MSNPSEDKKTNIILAALGVIPVVWAALMVAPFLSDGLAGIIEGFTSGMADPIWILLALPEKKMIRIMAKQELRRVPFIGWVMEKFRVIFVNRGAHDIAAFSQCVDALAREQEKLLLSLIHI